MSRNGKMSFFLIWCHMMRVISSPSSSTTGWSTLILSNTMCACIENVSKLSSSPASAEAGNGCRSRSRSSLTCLQSLRAHSVNCRSVRAAPVSSGAATTRSAGGLPSSPSRSAASCSAAWLLAAASGLRARAWHVASSGSAGGAVPPGSCAASGGGREATGSSGCWPASRPSACARTSCMILSTLNSTYSRSLKRAQYSILRAEPSSSQEIL
mmetsp:Transcript_15123/g.40157  ORF Transcript_15123/g.40157 Transcript_15123/m.40157 type:complete len:212 (+) Transcript_15123:979-1614(+)